MNELRGRVLKVSLARPLKGVQQPAGNRAIWESEEWLKQYAKPLSSGGGLRGLRGTGPEATDQDDAADANDAIQEDQ